MRLLSQCAGQLRRLLHAAGTALDPGEDDDSPPPEPMPERATRLMLDHDDLLWFKTSEDAEGQITLGLLECSPMSIGVLVDDNGEALGLRLSRAEAQDLHRSLVTWLAATARPVTA